MSASARSLAAAAGRWRRRRRLVTALDSAALGLPLAAAVVTAQRLGTPVWMVMALAVIALTLLVRHLRRRRGAALGPVALARHLDRRRPELEESSELMLAEEGELSLLGRLQRDRIEHRLAAAEAELRPPSLTGGVVRLALAVVVAALLPLAAEGLNRPGRDGSERPVGSRPGGTENVAEEALRTVSLRVVPPAYTGREPQSFDTLEASAAAGSALDWTVEASGEITSAALVFDERERLELLRQPSGLFTAAAEARETRLYRLELSDAAGVVEPGAYARLEVLPDLPPQVSIARPERFVEFPGRRGQIVEVDVEASDDYGLGAAALVATVASGFGELVEFRERRLEFDSVRSLADGARRYSARLDLDALGVAPGSEIFFFAEADDRRSPNPQRGRSATHIVRLAGDTSRSVGLASRLPILRVPEFFRSQRQIILDTERLLADEPSITAEEFRRRSESLGFDQRALRLRYGSLLGEEFESGRPAGAEDHADEHGDEARRFDELEPGGGGGREDVREALETLTQGLAHQHDSAEISTYFDSEIKAQLKAALEEMWGAEGTLRGIDPRRALPFEYRALTLLKQVQQRSRLYVQKIGFEAPVLYPEEKRLSGELDGIRTRSRRSTAREEDELAPLRAALNALLGDPSEPESVLAGAREAARRLAERARREPDLDLAGLESLRRWIGALEGGAPVDRQVEERAAAALWSLLPEPHRAPRLEPAPQTGLTRDYLLRLSSEGGS